MGLIKKAKPADAIEEELELQPEPTEEDPPAEADAPAAAIEEDEQAGDAATMAALAAAPAEPAAAGGDGLLDMFSTVGVHVEDKSLLVGMAGEVEMADLVTELALVAAALGVVKGQHAAEADEDEALAA